jgi:peroxiredoxin
MHATLETVALDTPNNVIVFVSDAPAELTKSEMSNQSERQGCPMPSARYIQVIPEGMCQTSGGCSLC